MTARLWEQLGVNDHINLELNTLGTAESRGRYRTDLVAYLTEHKNQLDDDSLRRLETNPLRILDSKNPQTQSVLDGAPSFSDYLDTESRDHFGELCARLDKAGVAYTVNPRLVRGLDYYGKTVFEWVTDALGAQGTVLGGGRYDALVEQLGGKPVSGIGFGMGVERLLLLLETLEAIPDSAYQTADAYLVSMGDAADAELLTLAETLRNALPELRLQTHLGGGSFKSKMKKADKSGARFALILGEDELANEVLTIKPLRDASPQRQVAWSDLASLNTDTSADAVTE